MSTLTVPLTGAEAVRQGRRRGLGPRLVLYTLLFSSVVTFFATGLQLYFDYARDVNAIESRLNQIERSYLNSIQLSLWTMDYDQIRAQLEGIRALPDMQYLEIEVNGSAVISVGADQGRGLRRQSFPLTFSYRDSPVDLGTLHVVASLDEVYQRLFDKFLLIFGSQAVKTFLVASFMLLLFQWLVVRHLAYISGFLRRKRLDNPSGVLALRRSGSARGEPDELDDVVNAFNDMCGHLQSSYNRLAESEERFDLAMRGANDGLWDWDMTSGAVYYSPRWKEMLGYRDHEIPGDFAEWIERVHPDDTAAVHDALERHLRGQLNQFESVHRLRHKNGSYRWILSRGQAIRDSEGSPHRVVGTHVDITAQKETEAALAEATRKLQEEQDRRLQAERLACVGEISASIAHEIRNPLASIINSLALMGSDKLPPEEREGVVEIVNDETHRLQRTLDDFLNFARLRPAQVDVHDLVPLLRETADAFSFGMEATPHGTEIRVQVDAPCLRARFDDDQIRQVIWNLMLNALQAMPDGGVLTLYAQSADEGLRVGVRDTGGGIPESVRETLTRPFVTGRDGGTGLGLSIVQRILAQHESELCIESAPGRGTDMGFHLRRE